MKALGIVLLIAGAALIFWGYNVSQSLGSQVSQALTGSPSDKAMYFYIGGGICALLGLFHLLRGGR